jgi:carboxylesterase type B
MCVPMPFWHCQGLQSLTSSYGGAFTYGASDTFDGAQLVRQSVEDNQPVIYVSLNYRIGIFGFPSTQKALDNGATNLGLRDASLGMQWVQDHIWAFGGDPSKVTIYGESAGGSLISLLYLQPDIKLFRNAIIESGGASIVPVGPTATVWPDAFNIVADFVGCAIDTKGNTSSVQSGQTSSWDCMKVVPSRLLLDGQNYLMALPRYANM